MKEIFRVIGVVKCINSELEFYEKKGILKFNNGKYVVEISDMDEVLEIKDFDRFQEDWKINLFV